MSYISREAVLDRLKCNRPEEGADGSKDRHRYMQWMADHNAITAIPSADVVEVIRCKDCKWWGTSACALWIVDETDCPQENDFCSFGERGDNADRD